VSKFWYADARTVVVRPISIGKYYYFKSASLNILARKFSPERVRQLQLLKSKNRILLTQNSTGPSKFCLIRRYRSGIADYIKIVKAIKLESDIE